MSLTMKTIRTFAAGIALALVPFVAHGAGAELRLDKAPIQHDKASLQNGAKLFINYCLNCHGASYLRYSRLQEIGLTDEQIEGNLLFTADKVGDLMRVAMPRKEATEWFGAAPPDLTLIARSRSSEFGSGADWLYTYLRQFYRDDSRPTGWNNVVFENVGMPHALWELQGEQVAHFVERDDGHGAKVKHLARLEIVKPGLMPKEEYDEAIADLVSFMAWMGEPAQQQRKQIGWWVLAVLAVLIVLTYLLKRAFWKDVH